MLTEVRLRDAWVLAALAALPALVLALLGLRALRGEEAAVRREAAVAVEAAARTAAADLEAAFDGLILPTGGADDVVVVRALRTAAAPVGGEPFVVDTAPLRLRAPVFADEGPPHDDGPASAACSAALAAHDRPAALTACVHAKGPSGRMLYPALALDPAGPVPAATLEAWIRAHQVRLAGTERAAIRADAARVGLPTVVALLDATTGVSPDLSAALLDPGFDRALREITTSTVVRVDGGIAHARRLPDGRVLGVFAGRAALATWVGARSPATLRLSLAGPPAGPAEAPVAWAKVTDSLGIRAELRDPQALATRATRSRRLLGGLAVAGASLALLGALLTVARLRRERRNAALRTDFVSTVSHELRTPIASIRMLAELLEQGRVEPGEQAETFAALAAESRRMGATVERLLGFGRLAAGRSVAQRRRVDLSEIVRAAVADAKERGLAVTADLPATEADVDPDQVRLALDNLLANVRKYAPDSPCEVTLEGTPSGVLLRVVDHGPGIPRQDRRRVFEPFERGDARLSRATEGSGIGLSLVAHVARAHDGKAWVEETAGGGASFVVTFGRTTGRGA